MVAFLQLMVRLEKLCIEGKPGSERPEWDIGEELPDTADLGPSEDSKPDSTVKSKEMEPSHNTWKCCRLKAGTQLKFPKCSAWLW